MHGLGHLDPQRSILLRFECMSSGELKVILLALYALLFLGFLSLIALIIVKRLVDFSKANVGMAVPCLSLLLAILSWGLSRIWRAWRGAKHWGRRRRRLVTFALVQTLLQTVNVTFWLTPHVHILITRCGWSDHIVLVSGLIQWTMWNTIFLTLTISGGQT
ncbi:hypothetical protein WJX75_009592 [Coccomyxa subellipsoidea]|uniref:Uncharacterized protein n=1 Tax=Coccomyxa subellipsoidea TaxID=248742 RepID=A0ABR2YK98_9CHLO